MDKSGDLRRGGELAVHQCQCRAANSGNGEIESEMKEEGWEPQAAIELAQAFEEKNFLDHHPPFAAPIRYLRLTPPFLGLEIRSAIRRAIGMLMRQWIKLPAQVQWSSRINENPPETSGQKNQEAGINRKINRGGQLSPPCSRSDATS